MQRPPAWRISVRLIAILIGASLVTFSSVARAAWPEKDVLLFVHSGAGSATDVMARAFAKALEEVSGKNVIVAVKGRDAMAAVLKANPDGYTFSTQTQSMLGELATGRTSYTLDDFQWIAGLVGETYILAVRADSPYKTAQDLFTAARKAPGDITMSTYRAGSTHQMAILLLNKKANAKFNIIPYDSGNETVVAMLGGNVDVVGTNPSNVVQHIEAGKARGLVVTSAKRLNQLPNVPTAQELGIDVTEFLWRGIIAKKGIPASVLAEMDSAIEKATATDVWRQYVKKAQLESLLLNHAAIDKLAHNDLEDVKDLMSSLKGKK